MTSQDFPSSFTGLREWSRNAGVAVSDAERRYAQYLILRAMSSNHFLRNELVFKGGNALEFVYMPNRSTTDLDFSFITTGQDAEELQKRSESELAAALIQSNDGFGTVLRLQGMKKNPPRPDAKFPTFTARVGYALPEQQRQRDRLIAGEPGANVIPVEMTLNEIVCEWSVFELGREGFPLNVSSVNDIISEKLRAILQQPVRNRYRSQDVIDIAGLMKSDSVQIDPSRISRFLTEKSNARYIDVNRSGFLDPEVRHRSAEQYVDLEQTTRYTFIPFDEAWAMVMELVDQLDIPD